MTGSTTAHGTSPDNGSLIDALYGALTAARSGVAEVMSSLELTDALADVLWQLGPAEAVPRRELAERLHCDPSNVTFLVDRLEQRGLIERGAHFSDRRIKAVKLTAAGEHARQQLITATENVTAFAALTASERRTLEKLLRRCAAGPAAGAPSPASTK